MEVDKQIIIIKDDDMKSGITIIINFWLIEMRH